MKKFLLPLIALMLFSSTAFAQDKSRDIVLTRIVPWEAPTEAQERPCPPQKIKEYVTEINKKVTRIVWGEEGVKIEVFGSDYKEAIRTVDNSMVYALGGYDDENMTLGAFLVMIVNTKQGSADTAIIFSYENKNNPAASCEIYMFSKFRPKE